MADTIIIYNNKPIPFPTPLVSLERENLYYNQYWGNSDKIVLNGQITGRNNCSPFASITSGQNNLLNIFNQNFGNFEILEVPTTTNNIFTFTGKNGAGQITGVIIQDLKTGIPFPLEFDVNLNFYPTDVKLNLIKLSHTYYGDIKMALVSPNESGVFIAFNSPDDLPGPDPIILNYDLIFSKDSTAIFSGIYSSSGTFKTAATGTNLYNQYLPFPIVLSGDKSLSMDIFTNKNPNGKWKLYVFDAIGGDFGNFSGAKLIFSDERIYQNSGIIVRSINFNESTYAGLIDYTIE
jgi:hypothetical protein